MTRFEERLRLGEPNEPAEWEEFLAAFHAQHSGATALTLQNMLRADGQSSYAVLANSIKPIAASARILDLGCGDGFGFEAVHATLPAARYVGIDLAATEVAAARERYPQAEFFVGRAQELPFQNESFDAVVSHLAIMLMSDAERVVSDCCRVLKPGGIFSFVVDNMQAVGGNLRAIHLLAGNLLRRTFVNVAALRMGEFNAITPDDAAPVLARGGFSAESARTEEYVVSARWSTEEIVQYFRRLYIVGSLPQAILDELLLELDTKVSHWCDPGGKVAVDVPLRLISARKPL